MSHALALLLSTAWLGHAATVYQSSAGFKSSAIEIGPAGVTDAAPVIMMRKKRADMDQHADTATDFASVDASAAVTHEQSPPLGNFSRVESSNPSSPSNDFAAPVDDAFVNSFVALLHDACSYSITLAVVQRTFHILPADPRRPQAHHAQAPSRRHKSITQLHHQKSVGGPFIDDDGGFFGESPIDSDDIYLPNPFSFEPGATFKQVFLEMSAKLCLMFVNLVFACVYRLAVVDETPVLDDSHASDFHMGDFEKGFCQCWDDRRTCLHSCFCLSTRQAHSMAIAGVAPFWFTYFVLEFVDCTLFASCFLAWQRNKLRRRLGYDPEPGEDCGKAFCFMCYPCVVGQVALHIDSLTKTKTDCCCLLSHIPDDPAMLVGPATIDRPPSAPPPPLPSVPPPVFLVPHAPAIPQAPAPKAPQPYVPPPVFMLPNRPAVQPAVAPAPAPAPALASAPAPAPAGSKSEKSKYKRTATAPKVRFEEEDEAAASSSQAPAPKVPQTYVPPPVFMLPKRPAVQPAAASSLQMPAVEAAALVGAQAASSTQSQVADGDQDDEEDAALSAIMGYVKTESLYDPDKAAALSSEAAASSSQMPAMVEEIDEEDAALRAIMGYVDEEHLFDAEKEKKKTVEAQGDEDEELAALQEITGYVEQEHLDEEAT